jgi:hypothetical protein
MSTDYEILDPFVSFLCNIETLSGHFNLRNLQDLLLFLQAWQINRAVAEHPHESKASSTTRESERISRRKTSYFISVQLETLNFVADLTQIIGKMTLHSESLRTRWTGLDMSSYKLICLANIIELKSEGRLNGILAGIVGPRIIFSAVNPAVIQGESGTESTITLLSISMKRILTLLEFNYERIIVLDVDFFVACLKDVWTSFSSQDPCKYITVKVF